jgi:hypothetical protein
LINGFVGAWRLLSFEEDRPDGRKSYPYGENPVGLLTYDASGYMSVQIMRSDRQLLPSDNLNDLNPDDVRSAIQGFTAFFGTFEIDEAEKTVVHQVVGHILPNSVGKKLLRRYEFSGDKLILKPSATRNVVWEKIQPRES